jgi:hypothetical protein
MGIADCRNHKTRTTLVGHLANPTPLIVDGLRYIIPALETSSPLDQHLNTNHLQPPLVRERSAIISSRHTSLRIIVDQFTQQAYGRQISKSTQVDSTLGVPFARENATFAGTERHQVAWTCKV